MSSHITVKDRGSLAFRVEDDTFNFPAVGVPYIVSSGGETLQWGRTDARGAFRLVVQGALPKHLSVRFLDGQGRVVVEERVNAGVADHRIGVPFDTWQAVASLARVPSRRAPRASYERYRGMVDRLRAASTLKGLAQSSAVERCLQAALAQDQLHVMVDRVLRRVPGALRQLMTALETRPSAGSRAGASFGPGTNELFQDILRVGAVHPGLGRALVGALIDIGRDTGPVVRFGSKGNGAAGLPNEWFDAGGPNPGRDDGLAPEVPDRGGVGGDLRPGDPATRCELALLKTYDAAVEPARAIRGGGHAAPGLSIVSIAPDFERQSGNRQVLIDVLTSAATLGDAAGRVPVSFPTRDGRVEVSGTVVGSEQMASEWLHRVDAAPPIRTIEGLVQVLGMPSECTGGQEPVTDPALSGLLDTVAACTGVSRFTGRPLAGSQVSPCDAVPPNWRGGVPEIHFRWTESGQEIHGDERICIGEAVGYRRADNSTKLEPTDRVRSDRQVFRLPDGIAVPLGAGDEEQGGCRLRAESVMMRVEADQSIRVDYFTTNDPTAPTSFTLSPPLSPAVAGAATHLIRGTYYHTDWNNPAVVPQTAWTNFGVGSVAGRYASITVPRDMLGRIAQPSLQLLRASASNALPGSGQRVLEILRDVRPARIESIDVRPQDRRTLTTSDAQVGPDEQVTIEVRVAMPTYAELGVSGTVEVKLGADVVGTASFDRHSKSAITLTVATINLRDFSYEGRTPVTATVVYSYTDAARFPEGVALGALAGGPAETTIVVLPRILVFAFPGQWGRVFNANGAFDTGTWAVRMVRDVRNALRRDGEQRLVTRLVGTGRVNQELPDLTPGDQGQVDWFFQNWGGTALDVPQRGDLKQERDGDEQTRGCVQLFVSEWAFEEGNNEWGGPPRPWDDQENAFQVDQYMDQSGIGNFITELMGPGNRRTHFVFVGHSRGGGASYNIMSWLERTQPSDRWHVLGAVFFDAMHTDGYFQPIIGFPVCTDAMLHFYATRPSGPITDKMNRYWNDDERPDCPGSTFAQASVDSTHGGLPDGPGVYERGLALVIARVTARVNATLYGG